MTGAVGGLLGAHLLLMHAAQAAQPASVHARLLCRCNTPCTAPSGEMHGRPYPAQGGLLEVEQQLIESHNADGIPEPILHGSQQSINQDGPRSLQRLTRSPSGLSDQCLNLRCDRRCCCCSSCCCSSPPSPSSSSLSCPPGSGVPCTCAPIAAPFCGTPNQHFKSPSGLQPAGHSTCCGHHESRCIGAQAICASPGQRPVNVPQMQAASQKTQRECCSAPRASQGNTKTLPAAQPQAHPTNKPTAHPRMHTPTVPVPACCKQKSYRMMPNHPNPPSSQAVVPDLPAYQCHAPP